MIYLLIISLLLFLIYIYDIEQCKQKKNTFFFIVLLLLIFTAGLSYRVGIDLIRYSEDYIPYPNIFELDGDYFATSREDPLWIIFTATFRTFTENYMWLHLVHAAFVNIMILGFIRKHSPYVFTTILIYFLTFYIFFNFETVRESLAVAIYLMSYKYLVQKKWIKYYLIAIVCFLAHSSAIFVFIIPFLLMVSRANIGKLLLGIFILFFALGRYINEVILESMQSLLLNERIAYKLTVYLGREEVAFSIGIFLKNVFFPAVVFLVNSLIIRKPTNFSNYTKMFLVLGCISMFIPVVDRLLNYLFVYYIINMAEAIFGIVTHLKEKSFKFLTTCCIVFFCAIAPLSWHFTIDNRISEYNYHRYFPYNSQFLKQTNEIRERFYKNGS